MSYFEPLWRMKYPLRIGRDDEGQEKQVPLDDLPAYRDLCGNSLMVGAVVQFVAGVGLES